MLGRFFGRHSGGNWRPPADELQFAAAAGFDTVQIRSDRPGEIEDELGIAPAALGELFDDAGLEPVLEMLVRHDGEPGVPAARARSEPGCDRSDRVPARARPPGRPERDGAASPRRLRRGARSGRGRRSLVRRRAQRAGPSSPRRSGRGESAVGGRSRPRPDLGHQPHAGRGRAAFSRVPRAVHARAVRTRRFRRRITTCLSAAATSTSRCSPDSRTFR